MARVKLSEFRTKKLLNGFLNQEYFGCGVDASSSVNEQIVNLDRKKKYVVKVDQGVKKRFKSGLIGLDLSSEQIVEFVEKIQKKGYSKFIVEPFLKYESNQEKYLMIERTREGYLINFSNQGGVDIEGNRDSIYSRIINYQPKEDIFNIVSDDEKLSGFKSWFSRLIECFDQNYFSFLELNPFLIKDSNPIFLDAACEVDDAGEFFVNSAWSRLDVVSASLSERSEEIENVRILAEGSQASLKLDLLNSEGSLFLLLSGGGASIVLADQLYDLGYGKNIANYGEYSGNPNEDETYEYTKNVISLLLKSKAKKKSIVIAGGVANFTDIRKTFKGIMKAIEERAANLRDNKVKIFVRRGGPYQREGLKAMRDMLVREGLFGEVAGPEMILTDIVKLASAYVGK